MFLIAWKNILHDRLRMCAALLGIIFAVVLVTFQMGLLSSCLANASAIIDSSGAPIWITAPSVANFEFSANLRESLYFQARAVPGVGHVERLVMVFVRFRKPDGSSEGAQLIGLDLEAGTRLPPAFLAGSRDDLRDPEAISVDSTDYRKLGCPRLGEFVEITDKRARVAAITKDVRSFIASPFLFTRFENAHNYARNLQPGQSTYLLVTPAPGHGVEEVVQNLKKLQGVDVLTGRSFARKSQEYWIFRTGAGFAIALATLLGFVVGVVIVGQTLYSSTMDRLKEFGTLKALGAGNRHLYGIITQQALIYAVAGYFLGILASFALARIAEAAGTQVRITVWILISMFFVTAAMCVAASVLSIIRVTKLEPAMVFK